MDGWVSSACMGLDAFGLLLAFWPVFSPAHMRQIPPVSYRPNPTCSLESLVGKASRCHSNRQ